MLLSDRLITKYINKKKDKPELITAKKIKTTDLQPIKSELCNKKIKKMMNKKIIKNSYNCHKR